MNFASGEAVVVANCDRLPTSGGHLCQDYR